MKKTKLLMLFLVIGLIVSLFNGCIPTIPMNSTNLEGERGSKDYDHYEIVTVPYIEQGPYPRCLAASTAMVLSYYGRDISVEWIADNIDTGPSGAWPSDLISYLENVLEYKVENKAINQGLSIKEIIKLIKNDIPVIAIQAYSLTNSGNHARVIYGYDNDFEWLLVHDPDDNTKDYITYSNFEKLSRMYWAIGKTNLCRSMVIQTGGLKVEADVDPKNGTVPLEVHCVGFASGGPIPYTYQWEFGDGNWSEKGIGIEYRNLFYTYTEPGKYKPVLHVKDSNGEKAKCQVKDVIVIPALSDPVHNLTKDTYYSTIQAALDDANDNNTIQVSDGTYYESITFPSNKKIILQSINGPSSTIIRGNDDLDTVTLNSSLEGTTLEGFTITHESGKEGRGIYKQHGYLDINNCFISDNTKTTGYPYGGGIYNYGGTLNITGTTVSSNTASFGGGIVNTNGATATITESTISNNTATNQCGGIANAGGTLTITSSNISNNFSAYIGGGIIHSGDSSLTITGCTISNNSSDTICGGIFLDAQSNQIVNIGGSSENDIDNFNEFINNYKTGNTPSPDNHIRNNVYGDCHMDYPYNYFTPNNNGAYALRDIGPAGGLIFYDKGSYSDGWRYLESAPPIFWIGKNWGPFNTWIGGTETGIGTGQANTTEIVNALGAGSFAAHLCDAHVVENNGVTYSDWFLPSKDELNLMYTNLKVFGVGNFLQGSYWSSSERSSGSAWGQDFRDGYDGYQGNYGKSSDDCVRAVRAF